MLLALDIVDINESRGLMFVDTDLLRMGADFSQSAGTIAQRAAEKLASTQPTAGIFGDFEVAHAFHQALCRAHDTHITTMKGHRTELESLADKAACAAAIFTKQDESCGSAVESARRDVS
ncbi:DUF2563 family protein [Mycobacterium sp. 3519A]|uniref:DUF2563 family protein n=1 Tax=Mycobacterium sp. 3519A TaxID=2057184 RepID=UPI000C7C8E23|nr:DUF2563 family protein [Mycobacterium sp. 3519A]